MALTLNIPDDLSRSARESITLDEYKSGRILGYTTRFELDGFLKAHEVYEEYTKEDFERERKALDAFRR